ncbi:hypothetical protein LCGC14_2115730 [marine sediment metagenome]|uniref:Uncharacterized protein n=1 Tax=marine sediment metagenome TaxID=412755 RepID=A0A0F9GIV0_9ZZZZ
MAQIPTATYKAIADAYHSLRSGLVGAPQFAEDALDAVVDLTTGTEGATEVELALLIPLNSGKKFVETMSNSTSGLVQAVRAVNNYVINNSEATTAQISKYGDKLSVFVMVTMENVWDNGCVPWYWEELSEIAGYYTGGWPTCPSA